MPRSILIDEIIVSLRAPPDLPEQRYRAMRRSLLDARFLPSLRRAIVAVLRQYRSLSRVRAYLSR